MAPVYDNGSSLFPRLNNDEMLEKILCSEDEINQRVYKFPTSHIKMNGRKSSYFEVINSLQFESCNQALERIVPRINFEKINAIINKATQKPITLITISFLFTIQIFNRLNNVRIFFVALEMIRSLFITCERHLDIGDYPLFIIADAAF